MGLVGSIFLIVGKCFFYREIKGLRFRSRIRFSLVVFYLGFGVSFNKKKWGYVFVFVFFFLISRDVVDFVGV